MLLTPFSSNKLTINLKQRFSNWETRLHREARTILRGGSNGNHLPDGLFLEDYLLDYS